MATYLLKLPDDLYERLKRLAEQTGSPMAAHVRDAIENYLQPRPFGAITQGGFVSGQILVMRVGS